MNFYITNLRFEYMRMKVYCFLFGCRYNLVWTLPGLCQLHVAIPEYDVSTIPFDHRTRSSSLHSNTHPCSHFSFSHSNSHRPFSPNSSCPPLSSHLHSATQSRSRVSEEHPLRCFRTKVRCRGHVGGWHFHVIFGLCFALFCFVLFCFVSHVLEYWST